MRLAKVGAKTNAAYKFFDNDKVDPEKILRPNREATEKRIHEEKVVLIIQDTTEQRRDRPSIAPPSRRETAAPARGDCCALSGLLGMFLSATQGGVTARKTRGHLPWADMLRPLRGKETRGNVSG